jgi:hypothetical protein
MYIYIQLYVCIRLVHEALTAVLAHAVAQLVEAAAPNRSDYQGYFLGSRESHCLGLTTLPLSCDVCLEIWEPQSPGTLMACPGV